MNLQVFCGIETHASISSKTQIVPRTNYSLKKVIISVTVGNICV